MRLLAQWWVRLPAHIGLTFLAYWIFTLCNHEPSYFPKRIVPILILSSGFFWLMLPPCILKNGKISGFSFGLESFAAGSIWAVIMGMASSPLAVGGVGIFNGLSGGVMVVLMISSALNSLLLAFIY